MNEIVEAMRRDAKGETAKGLIQIVLVAIVVLGTIGITFLLKVGAPSGPALSGAASSLVVDVIKPTPTQHIAQRSVTGEIEARANVILTSQVGGRVAYVSPRLMPGMNIPEGDKLFAIDASDYKIAVERARADVASATADLTQADADAENLIRDWQRVYPDEPAPDLVAKKPQRDALKARLEAARASLRQAELNLERTDIVAPANIRIIESSIEIGQLISPSSNNGTFYAVDSLRIRASAEAQTISQLTLDAGDVVRVQHSGQNAPAYDAQIISIGANLDNRTRLLPLFVSVPKSHEAQPGLFVSVTLNGEPIENVMRLPAAALATRTSIWRVNGEKLEEAPVEIHDITNDAVIISAIDFKDGIVVSQVPTSFVSRPVQIRNVIDFNREAGIAQ